MRNVKFITLLLQRIYRLRSFCCLCLLYVAIPFTVCQQQGVMNMADGARGSAIPLIKNIAESLMIGDYKESIAAFTWFTGVHTLSFIHFRGILS